VLYDDRHSFGQRSYRHFRPAAGGVDSTATRPMVRRRSRVVGEIKDFAGAGALLVVSPRGVLPAPMRL
jgi:hypothetical protein